MLHADHLPSTELHDTRGSGWVASVIHCVVFANEQRHTAFRSRRRRSEEPKPDPDMIIVVSVSEVHAGGPGLNVKHQRLNVNLLLLETLLLSNVVVNNSSTVFSR